MLTRFRIKTRLIVLMAVQALVLIGVGVYAVSALREAGNTVARLNGSTIEQVALNQLSEVLRNDLYGTVNDLGLEQIEWNAAQANLKAARNLFVSHWDEYQNDKTPQEIDELRETLAKHYSNVLMSFDDLILIVASQDRARLTAYARTQLNRQIGPFLTELGDRIAEAQLQSGNLFEATARDNVWNLVWTVLATVLGLAAAGTFGYYVYRSIRASIDAIAASVNRVTAGDAHARTGLIASDELGALGAAFDRLLDERVATLVRVEEENARLNESVITLLQAVSQLSQRDLTVRIPVTEDVTGPVADALNQLTGEMTRVLLGVRRIAEQVAKASTMVRMQSDVVISVAGQEHQEVEHTAAALDQAARTLNHITELSADCNSAAEQASKTTHTALQTVTATVAGINAIRATIHETEKRIKRLGERSNDIGRAIGLIGSIAERTHILALNASMHAAAAGEAGRGFAVVADEVQRLAENARDATQQIASLVSNIQAETAETVKQMNQAIAQVIDGSRMAEQAGEHMLQTQVSTDRLVAAVKQIARDTEDQVRLGSELQAHARSIQDSTRKTRMQMEEQTQYTKRLSQFSKGLLTAVQVFKLSDLRKVADDAAPSAPDAGDETEFAPAQQKVG